MKTRLFCAAAALIVLGAGCALDQSITLRLPSWFPKLGAPKGDAAAAATDFDLRPGTQLTVRPSTLGVTGAIDEALGNEERGVRMTLREVDPERMLRLDWNSASASGTVALSSYEGARAMLLPVFWPDGEARARANGGLWLSRSAFDSLKIDGTTEWRLGLAERTLATVSNAFETFNRLSMSLSGSASSTALASPFQLKKTGTTDSFPLMINGRLTLVRAIRASSWFADLFILDNRDNPLVLKVVVHPVAQPALKALAGAVRWDELGYDITSVLRP